MAESVETAADQSPIQFPCQSCGAKVEFVPGNRLGERAYFWFGDDKDNHVLTMDARALAKLVDGARTRG